MIPEYLQYSQMLFMLFSGLRVYEDIIYEYYDRIIKVFAETLLIRSTNAASVLVRPNDMKKNS